MQYPNRSVNGDAAQYFTAYKLTRLFQWPCRLTTADVGIDGEVEIVDACNSATGDVIKLQIKGIEDPGVASNMLVYVEDRHIAYWQRFCVPVVLCAVDLTHENIFWRQMTATETYKSTGRMGKIEFSTSTDLLTAASKVAWTQLAAPTRSRDLTELFRNLRELEPLLPTQISDGSMTDDLIALDEQYQAAHSLVVRAEQLIIQYPWRVGIADLGWFQGLQQHLAWIHDRVGQLHHAW